MFKPQAIQIIFSLKNTKNKFLKAPTATIRQLIFPPNYTNIMSTT